MKNSTTRPKKCENWAHKILSLSWLWSFHRFSHRDGITFSHSMLLVGQAKCVSRKFSWAAAIQHINFFSLVHLQPARYRYTTTHCLELSFLPSQPNLRSQFRNENFKRHSSMRKLFMFIDFLPPPPAPNSAAPLNLLSSSTTTNFPFSQNRTTLSPIHSVVVSLSFTLWEVESGRVSVEWKPIFPPDKFNKCHRRRPFNYSYTNFHASIMRLAGGRKNTTSERASVSSVSRIVQFSRIGLSAVLACLLSAFDTSTRA